MFVRKKKYESDMNRVREGLGTLEERIREVENDTITVGEYILPLTLRVIQSYEGEAQQNEQGGQGQNQEQLPRRVLRRMAREIGVREEDLASLLGTGIMINKLGIDFPPDRFSRGYRAIGYIFRGKDIFEAMREADIDQLREERRRRRR
jgi:hypothetical protein